MKGVEETNTWGKSPLCQSTFRIGNNSWERDIFGKIKTSKSWYRKWHIVLVGWKYGVTTFVTLSNYQKVVTAIDTHSLKLRERTTDNLIDACLPGNRTMKSSATRLLTAGNMHDWKLFVPNDESARMSLKAYNMRGTAIVHGKLVTISKENWAPIIKTRVPVIETIVYLRCGCFNRHGVSNP